MAETGRSQEPEKGVRRWGSEILQGDNREGELLDCGVKLKCHK